MNTMVFATVFLLSFWVITSSIYNYKQHKLIKKLMQENKELLGASRMLAEDYRDCLLRESEHQRKESNVLERVCGADMRGVNHELDTM